MDVLMTLTLFAVAISSSLCARMTRPDRNYYPMQRVIWTVLGFIYGGSAISSLFVAAGHQSPVGVRLAFSGAVLLATTYSLAFMRRRNRTPRFIPIDARGEMAQVNVEDLRSAHTQALSYLQHGAMPAGWVAELDAARAKWQEYEDWRKDLGAFARARRRR